MAQTRVGLAGQFLLTHWRPGRGLVWQVLVPNGVTVQGADHLNGVALAGRIASSDWRLGLISDAAFMTVSPADTHGAHPGWTEYAGTTRAAWSPTSPATGVLYNPTPAAILIPASGAVRGVFLANRFTVGSTDATGTLYATAVAAAGLAVVAGGTIFITYGVTAQGL